LIPPPDPLAEALGLLLGGNECGLIAIAQVLIEHKRGASSLHLQIYFLPPAITSALVLP
jgi:hypothetical protein